MDRMDAPAPFRRRGPRPLPLHLMMSQISADASTNWSGASPPCGIDTALVAGIAAYRRHPYRRTLRDPPSIWSDGDTRLLDYGTPRAGTQGSTSAPTLLFVPSLINRAYVLDLAPGASMMRWLSAHGVRPLLLDWGWPGPEERRFTLTDYVSGRLAAAAEAAVSASGAPVAVAGYCMGGLLALALALSRPELVSALALLATPWDFHAPSPRPARGLAAALPWLDPALTATGTLPVDALQAMFALLDPGQVAAKYRAFGTLAPGSEEARRFVALEDWLNDGVPLAAPVAREAIGGWYGANAPARNEWRIAGLPVDPARLRQPCFVAVPGHDRIVPAESARALVPLLPNPTVHAPRAGHVGMVAGTRAEAELWTVLRRWLCRVSQPI